MDKDSSQNLQVSKFKTIPHVNITEFFPIQDLIIVKSHLSPENEQKNQGSPNKFDADAEFESSSPEFFELDDSLKEEFPQTVVTPSSFGEKYSKILSYLEELNRLSTKIETSKSKKSGPQTESFDIKKINKLKVSASLNRMLHRNLRIPTINEIITVATNMNMKEAESLNGNFIVSSDYENNPWSELNLFKFFKDRVKLETYQLLSGGLRYTSPLISKNIHSHLLMTGPKCDLSFHMFHKKATDNYFKNNTVTTAEIVEEGERIITISFYHNVRGHKYREYDILSFQNLANLTDSFRCSSQIISEDFDLEVRGSCYMINGVLYPDLRDGACDYSENLIEFYKTEKTGVLKSYEPVPQDAAVLNNIEFNLYDSGYFLHQGDCEHRVTVTNVRIFDKTRDCPYVKCYPLCTFMPNQHKVDCQVCNTNEAQKTVFNSLLMPNNPSYLCNECYGNFKNIKLGSHIYFDKGLTPSIAIEYNQD